VWSLVLYLVYRLVSLEQRRGRLAAPVASSRLLNKLRPVILSEALDRTVWGEVKNLRSCKIEQLQGSFLRFTQDRLRLLRMTCRSLFSNLPQIQGLLQR
jgi:hypothetical protein